MNSRLKCGLTTLAVCMMPFCESSFSTAQDKQDKEESNLIFEDSFEKGGRTPDGWKSGANIPGVEYVYDKRAGATGKHSLSLKKSVQRYFPIAQWFRILPVPKSRMIEVKAKVKAKAATKAIIEIQYLNESGRMMGKKWLAYIGAKKAADPPATHDWKEYGDTAEIPENTKQILIGLQIYGPGQVWFDDLRITPANSSGSGSPGSAKESKSTTISVNGTDAQYIYAAPREPDGAKPKGLLIVLPGGDGSAEFHPFVSRIHKNATGADVALAQPVARKWTADQQITWPTATNKATGMKYSTEELIAGVIKDVEKKHKLDPGRIFVLGWSSGGPAAYASLLQKGSLVSGGLIAMSVFKPDTLPSLKNGAGKKFYLLHSPQDRVCPHWMAKQAVTKLTENGAAVKLVDYEGGHGWRGNVYGNIRTGINWLKE